MSLSTEADVAAAEGDLAALRVHADRLADGFVKRRLATHLRAVAVEARVLSDERRRRPALQLAKAHDERARHADA